MNKFQNPENGENRAFYESGGISSSDARGKKLLLASELNESKLENEKPRVTGMQRNEGWK